MDAIYKKLKPKTKSNTKPIKPLNVDSIGIVYFLGNVLEGIVKVGYTTDETTLKQRLKSLQTGNHIQLSIFKTVPGTYTMEKSYQRALNAYSLNGDEWFRLCPYVILYCQLTDIIDIT